MSLHDHYTRLDFYNGVSLTKENIPYDCMPYMCLAVLYVLSCMFSVTIVCCLIDDSKAQ